MQSVQSGTGFLSGLELGVVCHCRDTEAASYDFQLCDFVRFCSKLDSFKVLRCPSAGVSHSVYTLPTPNTHKRKGGKEKWRRTQLRRPINVVSSTSVLVSFPPLPSFTPFLLLHHWSSHAIMERLWVSLCVCPLALSLLCPGSGGLRRVIAFQCPCTSCAVWTPGLWKGLGPASSESGPGASCQTSWQTCSCRSDAGQNGPGQPSETPGSSGGVRRW